MNSWSAGRAVAAAGLIAVAGVAARALWVEPRRMAVRRRTLRLVGWPAALDGLEVALVADLHAGAAPVDLARVEHVVARVEAVRPELVVLLGDLVDCDSPTGEPVPPEDVAQRLGRLRPPLGVLAVLGNHDWRAGGTRVAHALRAAGIVVLENDAIAVRRHGTRLWLAGLADATERTARIAEALAGVPEHEPVVVLSHHPDVFPSLPDHVALTLSGHTHGGQVDLPWLRRAVIPSRFGDRYAAGHVVEGDRQLFVSRGIGASRFPIRFRSPPEVVVLTLRARRPDRS